MEVKLRTLSRHAYIYLINIRHTRVIYVQYKHLRTYFVKKKFQPCVQRSCKYVYYYCNIEHGRAADAPRRKSKGLKEESTTPCERLTFIIIHARLIHVSGAYVCVRRGYPEYAGRTPKFN